MQAMRLVPIDASNWTRTLDVRVADDQLRFLADHQPVALVILSKAFLRVGGAEWEALAMETSDGSIVGVLAIAHHRGGPEEDESWIFHFAIDEPRQRSGFGTAAISATIDTLRAQGCSVVKLTVHAENEVAQRLYSNVGFVATGETRFGEEVWELERTHG